MPTDFNSLQTQLNGDDRLQKRILRLAAIAYHASREGATVEVCVKHGKIYSRDPPPPLLHVCKLSRAVAEKIFKPSFARFVEEHLRKQKELAARNRDDGQGKIQPFTVLQDVWIDMRVEKLRIAGKEFGRCAWGKLEFARLEYLVLDLDGWVEWGQAGVMLRFFKGLKRVDIGGKVLDKGLEVKMSIIEEYLKEERQDAMAKRPYKAPTISCVKLLPREKRGAIMELGRQRAIKRRREEREEETERRSLERSQKRFRGQGTAWDIDKYQTDRNITPTKGKENLPENLHSQTQQLSTTRPGVLAKRLEPPPVDSFSAFLSNSQAFLRSSSPETQTKKAASRPSTSSSTLESPESPLDDAWVLIRSSQHLLRSPSPQLQTRRAPVSRLGSRKSDSNNSSALPCSTRDHLSSHPPPLRTKLAISRGTHRSSSPTRTPLESYEEIMQLIERPGVNSLSPHRPTQRERDHSLGAVDDVVDRHENLTHPRSRSRTSMSLLASSHKLPSRPGYSEGAAQEAIYPKSITDFLESSTSLSSSSKLATSQKYSSSTWPQRPCQDTSVFASTPNSQELLAINPSLLMLQGAEMEDEQIDQGGAIDSDLFVPEEVIDKFTLSAATNTHIQKTSSSSAIPSSRSRDASSVSANSTQLFVNTSAPESIAMAIPNAQPEKRKSASRPRKTTAPSKFTKTSPKDNSKTNCSSSRASPDEDVSAIHHPFKIHASRPSPHGLELLIEWKGYPSSEDRTWKLESEIYASVPDLVRTWWMSQSHDTKAKEKDEEEYVVEKILDTKVLKGVLHYLVKWKGYEKVGDRTWEPAETLTVDVPGLVEGFERRRGMRKKGGGNGKAGKKAKKEKVW